MTIENAKAEMLASLTAHAEKFSSLGFITSVRSYYTDKSLEEHEELCRGAETLWCELSVRCEGMDEDDGLVYDLYADLERDGVNIKENEENEGVIETALTDLYNALAEAPDPTERFMEEYRKATEEFDAEMAEFERKLKRMKYISYGAAAVAIVAIVIIFLVTL